MSFALGVNSPEPERLAALPVDQVFPFGHARKGFAVPPEPQAADCGEQPRAIPLATAYQCLPLTGDGSSNAGPRSSAGFQTIQ